MPVRHTSAALAALLSEEKPYRASILATILARIGADLAAAEATIASLAENSSAPEPVQSILFEDFVTCGTVADLATPAATGAFQGYVSNATSGLSGSSVWLLDITDIDSAQIASVFSDPLALVLSDQALGAFVSEEELALIAEAPSSLEGLLRVGSDEGALPAGCRFVFGFSSTRDDAFDDVATRAWFRCDGSNQLYWETDDGTTASGLEPTGVTLPSNGRYTRLKVVMETDGVKFYVNDVLVGETADFAPTGVLNLRIIAEVQKDSGTAALRSQIDWIRLVSPRQSAVTLPIYM